MDTETAKKGVDPANEQIQTITRFMPRVHAAIKSKAHEIGPRAYNLVRRAARGEAGCFYAFEAGRVVGTPFGAEVPTDVAQLVARYGLEFVCVWPDTAEERDSDGKA